MDFITQLFSALNTADSWKVLLFLFISFLIGWLFAWLYYRGRISALQAALDRKSAEFDALKVQYDAKLEALALKEADLKKAYLEIEDLYARIKRLETEKGQLHADLYAANETIAKLQAELAAKGSLDAERLANIDALNNQILGLQTRAKDLEGKATYGASLNTELDGLKADNAKLQAQLSDWDKLKNQNVSLLADIDALNARLRGLEENLAACNDKNAGLLNVQAENGKLKDELSDLRTNMAMATAAPVKTDENIENKAAFAQAQVKAALGSRIASATAADKDDLKRINGIGPFIEKKLNDLGIYTFEQVSQFDADMVEKVTDAIEFFPGRIDRDDWVGQAKKLYGMKLAGTLGSGESRPKPDDLKIVEGIGPKIEQLLKNDGIHTWADLAASSTERLQAILNAAGDRFRVHNPSTWAEQARLANEGLWDKLKEYQDYLIGGRDLGNKD